jgi:tetratricopeptide (TPR) repeat protein
MMYCRQVPFWWSTKAEALFREGQAWMQIERAQDAEAAWRQYIIDDPNHPSAKPFQSRVEVELINLLALEDRWAEAREIIWKAWQRAERPAREDLLIMSLRSYLERSSPQASIGVLRRYVAADPTDGKARRALALQAQALGLTEEADRNIQICLKTAPKDPLVWRDWLEILDKRGDSEGLARALAQAPPEADAEAGVWARRALIRTRAGDLEGAVEAFRQAMARREFEPDFHYRLSLIEQHFGHTEKAASHRARFQALKTARDNLGTELDTFLQDQAANKLTDDRRKTTYARLAQYCRTLGLSRDADGWEALLPRTGAPQPGKK